MARPFKGQGSLEAARKARDEARTADELRAGRLAAAGGWIDSGANRSCA
ncbi:MAG: hypothetical protein JWR68_2608, partial [Polaromonas sp.]|nr:hypothetical protein [Polaromonas sp.]